MFTLSHMCGGGGGGQNSWTPLYLGTSKCVCVDITLFLNCATVARHVCIFIALHAQVCYYIHFLLC